MMSRWNKSWLLSAGCIAAALALPAAAADVGVSISISEPGVYGRIDIGRFPQPQFIVTQPMIVTPPRVVAAQPVQPVYLWVPPGHRKNWRKHCSAYRACGAPVFFVRHDWYDQHVLHRHPGKGRGHGKSKDRDD